MRSVKTEADNSFVCAPSVVDTRLANLLEQRKKQVDEDEDAGFYMHDDDFPAPRSSPKPPPRRAFKVLTPPSKKKEAERTSQDNDSHATAKAMPEFAGQIICDSSNVEAKNSAVISDAGGAAPEPGDGAHEREGILWRELNCLLTSSSGNQHNDLKSTLGGISGNAHALEPPLVSVEDIKMERVSSTTTSILEHPQTQLTKADGNCAEEAPWSGGGHLFPNLTSRARSNGSTEHETPAVNVCYRSTSPTVLHAQSNSMSDLEKGIVDDPIDGNDSRPECTVAGLKQPPQNAKGKDDGVVAGVKKTSVPKLKNFGMNRFKARAADGGITEAVSQKGGNTMDEVMNCTNDELDDGDVRHSFTAASNRPVETVLLSDVLKDTNAKAETPFATAADDHFPSSVDRGMFTAEARHIEGEGSLGHLEGTPEICQEDRAIVRRTKAGEYKSLAAPARGWSSIMCGTTDAVNGKWLSHDFDVALRTRGCTLASATQRTFLVMLRQTMRRRTLLSFACLLLWSIAYNISISICLRELILWLHNCSESTLHSQPTVITNGSCAWTNHSMQVMTNHSFFGLLSSPTTRAFTAAACAGDETEKITLTQSRVGGIKWAILLFITLVIQAVSWQVSMRICEISASACRMSLMSMIYGKAMVSAGFCDKEMRDSDGSHARHLFDLLVGDVDTLIKAEQHRHILWIIPLHFVTSVVVILRDMPAITMLVVLFSATSAACMVLVLSYSVSVVSARSKQRVSLLRVDRVMEFLVSYVDLVLLGWQNLFLDAIEEARAVECDRLRAQAIIRSVSSTWTMVAGQLGLVCLLLAGTLQDKDPASTTLSPGLIVAMCQTTSLTSCLALFALVFPKLYDGKDALHRIIDFLVQQDRKTYELSAAEKTHHAEGSAILPVYDASIAVCITDAIFRWRPKVDKRSFRIGMRGKELNLIVRKNERLGIVAPKFEGKTSFLCAIAGLMPRERGQLHVAGKLFLCREQPLLIDGTIQENILFGLPYDEAMYKRALYCSGLDDRLKQLRLRDLTRVGRNNKGSIGFNTIAGELSLDTPHLAAIGLARAIYADADVYLFDNSFHALGDDDGKVVLDRCIKTQLRHATVIVACNSTSSSVPILAACDRIALLGSRRYRDSMPGGEVVAEILDLGSYSDLIHRGINVQTLDSVDSVADPWEALLSQLWAYHCDPHTVRLTSESAMESSALSRGSGGEMSSLLRYFCGHVRWISMTISILATSFPVALRGLMGYLVLIMCARQLAAQTDMECLVVDVDYDIFVAYAGCILFLCMLFYMLSGILWLRCILLPIGETMHARIMEELRFARKLPLVAKHLWIGLGADALVSNLVCLDESLPGEVLVSLEHLGCVLTQYAVLYFLISLTPINGLFVLPIVSKVLTVMALYVGGKHVHKHACRKSEGLHLIREFCFSTAGALFLVHTTGCVKQFRFSMDVLISSVGADDMAMSRTKFAMALAIDVICACLVLVSALMLVLGRDALFQSGSTVVGGHLVAGLVQLFCFNQIAFYALGRGIAVFGQHLLPLQHWHGMLQTTDPLASDDSDDSQIHEMPIGALKISNVCVIHDGRMVLQNISLHLNMHEYLVVLGAGGAGKTTLGMCILRAIQLKSGSIEIGNVDVENIHYQSLRKFVGMVPSQPILFRGSMLANLDPVGLLQQSEILPLLIAVGLVDHGARTMPDAMKVVIQDVSRISGTVKQLLCLCRVLLRKPQLLILDEFGANIDGRRIRSIDRFLRTQNQFGVLQFSRNFQHVQHCARVVILHEGQVVEQGSPASLLADQHSRLRTMVRQHGPAFIHKFRCDIDLWEAELAEKNSKSLRSTMLQHLEAEWDSASINQLHGPLLSPSSFLRGTTSSDLPRREHSERNSASGVKQLRHQDEAFQMQVARSCIAWLHASLCRDDAQPEQVTAISVFLSRPLEAQQRRQVQVVLRKCCNSDWEDIGDLSSDCMVIVHVMLHALAVLSTPLLSPSMVEVVNQAHVQGPEKMELIVERILEDDDSGVELLIQLLYLLSSLTQISSELNAEALARHFARVLASGEMEEQKGRKEHLSEHDLGKALYALLKHAPRLFGEKRLWSDTETISGAIQRP
jgi:ABC-type multidrug transport system fused ATPase/permease subunit